MNSIYQYIKLNAIKPPYYVLQKPREKISRSRFLRNVELLSLYYDGVYRIKGGDDNGILVLFTQ